MRKVLFISNITKKVGSFSVASIIASNRNNMEFYFAANWNASTVEQRQRDEEKYGIKIIHIDLDRSPYSLKNLKAYKQLVELITKEKIEYIHCNTPIGGILGRLVGRKCGVKKIIYQVHGFHFYEGAPIKNWILYYPVEKWLAKKTDAIITINKEDFERAKTFKLRNNGRVYFVPGVGMDLKQYILPESIRLTKRVELGLKNTDIMLISMGDLITRKNYPVAIETIWKAKNMNLQYYICGEGPEEERLKQMVKKLSLCNQIHFLGYRTDIKELLCASDIFLFTSKQEGLARSLMEAMASGLPCVVSRIRGNIDLIEDTQCGYLCTNTSEYVNAINELVLNKNVSNKCKINSMETIKKYSTETVINELTRIYSSEFRK